MDTTLVLFTSFWLVEKLTFGCSCQIQLTYSVYMEEKFSQWVHKDAKNSNQNIQNSTQLAY